VSVHVPLPPKLPTLPRSFPFPRHPQNHPKPQGHYTTNPRFPKPTRGKQVPPATHRLPANLFLSRGLLPGIFGGKGGIAPGLLKSGIGQDPSVGEDLADGEKLGGAARDDDGGQDNTRAE
jgi:hypothetical protein